MNEPLGRVGEYRRHRNINYYSGETQVLIAGQSRPNGYSRKVQYDGYGRSIYDVDAVGNASYPRWSDGIESDQLKWTDTTSTDSSGATVFMRTGHVYDTEGRETETWGPAPRSDFGASSYDNGNAFGGAGTAKTNNAYDGGINGLASRYWPTGDLSGPPTLHGYSTTSSGDWGSVLPSGLNKSDGTPLGAGSPWSVRFTGSIYLSNYGQYYFPVGASGGVRVYIGNVLATDFWDAPQGTYTSSGNKTGFYAPSAKKYPITIEYRNTTGTAKFDLSWSGPGVSGLVPSSNLSPRFDLVTATSTRETSSVGRTTVSEYTYPHLGLATATVEDSSGVALRNETTYETPGVGFLRRTSMRLPSGAGSQVVYSYYGGTEGPVAGVCGVTGGVSQAGLAKSTVQADPDGGGPGESIVRQYVYDVMGRQRGIRTGTISTVGSAEWTCTSVDARGRTVSVAYPGWGTQPARTVTYNYGVGGNPLITSVSDTTGTITTTSDLLGRTVSYSDVWAKTSTATYTQGGHLVTATSPAGTYTYTYTAGNQVDTVALNGKTLSDGVFDTFGDLTGVTYPAGPSGGGNGTTGTFTSDSYGRAVSMTWKQPDGVTITSDEVTGRDLLGRVTDYSSDGIDPNPGGANYIYDGAGRLITAKVFNATPAVGAGTATIGYEYASTGGCGTATTAGRNSNRTTRLFTPSVGAVASTSYCYDHADRLSSTTTAGITTVAYDARGNTTVLGAQTHVYDGADRHMETMTTVGTQPTVSYVRDATDRIVARKLNGTIVAKYSYTATGDTADITLDAAGNTVETTTVLTGGVLWTQRVGGIDVWSYPNIHGDLVATVNTAGIKQGSTRVFDPYGEPLGATTIADNSAGDFDYGWHGQQQRPLEHQTDLTPIIEMGARQYSPTLGRFLQTDPIEGGSANDYDYSNADPINSSDLDGNAARVRRGKPKYIEVKSGKRLPTSGARPFKPGKNFNPKKPTRRGGYLDKNGNEWIPCKGGGCHGGFHWDVNHSDGRHTNVRPDGSVRGPDNFRSSLARGWNWLGRSIQNVGRAVHGAFEGSSGCKSGELACSR